MTTIQGTANQYVWIPVENPSDIYGTLESPVEGIEGTKFGKLYFKTKTEASSKYNWPVDGEVAYSKTSYREPAVLSEYDTDAQYYKTILGYNSVDEYKAGMIKEFNDMITSVEKYKGFYIGRYELTGSISQPSLCKGKSPIRSKSWYQYYDACINLESVNEAAKDKVRTTIVWGCQWDQAVKMCLLDKIDFLKSPNTFGVNTGDESPKVSGTKSAAYNIFDMCGNLYDWTLEAEDARARTCRGGYWQIADFQRLGSSRSGGVPDGTWTYSDCGVRGQLYIK